MATKKWAQKVDLKQGALGAMGWPNADKVFKNVTSGSTSYATAMRRLGFIANAGHNQKARALMDRLMAWHKKSSKAKK